MHCLDIGGSTIVAATVRDDLSLGVVSSVATPSTDFEALCNAIEGVLPLDGARLAIAIAAVIDPRTSIALSANLPCLTGRKLAHDLARRLARPITLVNDADAFGLAESECGPAKGRGIVFAVILGTGIGGAIVIDGRVLGGTSGTAGEWGHGPASAMRTGARLPIVDCACAQRGCIDTLAGARGLERLYQHRLDRCIDSRAILSAWHAGQSGAAEVVDVWLDVVGGALAAMVNLLDPVVVPVGGGLANDVRLIDALDREVRSRALGTRDVPLLYATDSAAHQALIGAALHAREAPSTTC